MRTAKSIGGGRRTAARYRVWSLSPEERMHGSVILRDGMREAELANALLSVGIYAPRGADRVAVLGNADVQIFCGDEIVVYLECVR